MLSDRPFHVVLLGNMSVSQMNLCLYSGHLFVSAGPLLWWVPIPLWIHCSPVVIPHGPAGLPPPGSWCTPIRAAPPQPVIQSRVITWLRSGQSEITRFNSRSWISCSRDLTLQKGSLPENGLVQRGRPHGESERNQYQRRNLTPVFFHLKVNLPFAFLIGEKNILFMLNPAWTRLLKSS